MKTVFWEVWGPAGAIWGPAGASWGPAGGQLGAAGGQLGASWGLLGASWGLLGASWVLLGPAGGHWGPAGKPQGGFLTLAPIVGVDNFEKCGALGLAGAGWGCSLVGNILLTGVVLGICWALNLLFGCLVKSGRPHLKKETSFCLVCVPPLGNH